ncbi:MAG: LysR family transcriptional regulator [Microbacterium sp.]
MNPVGPENVETLDLLVFMEVVRSGSFGGAARRLLITTPSASVRVSGLEKKLGCRLFTRTPRGSQLTAEGHTFLTYARRALTILEEAHHAVLSNQPQRAVMAIPASLGSVIYPHILDLWTTMNITGDYRVAHSREVIEFILDGTASLGMVINTPLPNSVVGHRVCRSPLRAIVSADHPLARASSVALDDAQMRDVAIYRWGPEAVTLASTFDDAVRVGRSKVHLIGLPTIVLELVRSSRFVGIVPEFAARSAIVGRDAVILPLQLPEWSLDVQLVHSHHLTEDPSVRALVNDIAVLTEQLTLHSSRAASRAVRR